MSSDRNAIREYKALLACFAITGQLDKPIPPGGYGKMAQLSGMGERECERALRRARKAAKAEKRLFLRLQAQENDAALAALEADVQSDASDSLPRSPQPRDRAARIRVQRPIQQRNLANRQNQAQRRAGAVEVRRQPSIERRREQQMSPPRTPTVIGDREGSPATSPRQNRLNKPKKGRRMTLQVSLNAIIKTPMRDEHWEQHPELKAFIEAGVSP